MITKNWTLSKNAERRFSAKHPWVFSNELSHSPKGIEAGQLIRLQSESSQFLAWGYGNPSSLIAFRRLSNIESEMPSYDFFLKLLKKALDKRVLHQMHKYSFRLCFAEGDFFPGLILERYLSDDKQIFVAQILTAGCEQLLRPDFLKLMEDLNQYAIEKNYWSNTWEQSAVILKNDTKAREMESLKYELPEIIKNFSSSTDFDFKNVKIQIESFELNKPVHFVIDIIDGQKTGFFLDQSANIQLLISYLDRIYNKKQIRILDLFSYVGQWGTQIAAWAKAKGIEAEVHFVDASERALELCQRNASPYANKVECKKMDIIEQCKNLTADFYDVVICDPPALIKSKKDYEAGKRAYAKVNLHSMRALKSNGFYVSCSCSHHLSELDLLEVVTRSKAKLDMEMQCFAKGLQALDHPVRFEFEQGLYLKALLAQRI